MTVSIRLMCYNHAEYIYRCLEGIYNQETDCLIEVVVGDDLSQDNTLKIIESYASEHRKENINWNILDRWNDQNYIQKRKDNGRLYNFVDILRNCTGEYIALIDGDDYWTDTKKLQKQVTFIKENPGFSIVFNNYNKLIQQKIVEGIRFTGEIDFEKFMKKNSKSLPIQTSSALFRNNSNCIDFFAKHFMHNLTADYALFLLILTSGKGYILDDAMSVYRVHQGGVSNNFQWDSWYEIRIEVLEKLLKYNRVPNHYKTASKVFLKTIHKKYAKALLKQCKILKGSAYLLKWVSSVT